ncbi:MAG: 1-acyl-sn-glycerol-3-phosphate acyltransferase [Acidobacteria bacterium]|nr:1-acyl-sn-glycerol-3-phosphate acyltransferase [Acidobacteriota bacterium]MBV9477142.1 1-acyl-sn-glycerol-3-phosphate acyltransferase [Acidobacteriota bacterium]
MRKLVTAFLALCMRIFYRRIELAGTERIPDGPVIFAMNHPNGLVDPLFLVCFAPRPVSFLAKAPLFRYPVISFFVHLFDSIPVYRKQDHNTRGSNEETFSRARDVLRRGGAIAIFPEGTTHDDAQLRELKTGAARIALGARLEAMSVVPVGIYYTAKHVFRSSALVVFGEPLTVASSDESPGAVEQLTAEIDAGLDAVTLQADSRAALALVARAEDIFSATDALPLPAEFGLQRRFVDGYRYLATHDPARLARLETAVTQFEAELRRAGVDVQNLVHRGGAARAFRVIVLLPLALLGAIVSYPTYRLIGVLAKRFSGGEDAVVATIKLLAALALYPLTYLAIAYLVGMRFGVPTGLVVLLVLPFLAYLALRVFEDIDEVLADARAFAHRDDRARLLQQREAIRNEFVAVAEEMAARR